MSELPVQNPSYTLRRLVDQVPALLAYWNQDLRCCFANQAYQQWFGVEPGQLIGTHIRDLLGPALFALNEHHIRAALRGEQQVFERVIPGPDGVQRHSLATYVPDVVDGVVQGFFAQVSETTPLKQIEARLRASESLLDRTGRLAGVGGWSFDLKTQEITWSQHTRRIHGVPDDYRPVLSMALDFYPPQARPVVEAAVRLAAETGASWDLELPMTSADGRALWVRTLGEVEYEDGQPVRLIGAFQDITEHRQRQLALNREQALRAQSEQHAQELDRLLHERGEMLDVLAHEVRQPLNNASAALQGAAAALAEVGQNPASDRLDRAQRVMGSVLASIDNTLAVASLLARPGPIQRTDTDVNTLIAVAVADMPQAERARVRLDRRTQTSTASMDMSLMRLALRNLLSNALRYSPPGSEVTLRLSDSDDPLGLVIDVVDAGPGIPDAVVPHLFERRPHRDGLPAPAGHGLGLGLYIVRRVMELHGGTAELLAHGPGGTSIRLTVVLPADD